MISLSPPSHDSFAVGPTAVPAKTEFVDDDPLCIKVTSGDLNMQFLVQLDKTITDTAEHAEIEKVFRNLIEVLLQNYSTPDTILRLSHHTHVRSVSVLLASMPQKKNMEDDAEDTDKEKTH
ncbi:MAG: hypothetical protein WCV62_00265 [Candidatus Peribacteraceae bacterium]|jgi:hypothetical protein